MIGRIGVVVKTERKFIRRSSCGQFEFSGAEIPVAFCNLINRIGCGHKFRTAIDRNRKTDRLIGYSSEDRTARIINLLNRRKGKREVRARSDIDIIDVELRRSRIHRSIRSSRNNGLFSFGRIEEFAAVGNRSAAASVAYTRLIEHTAFAPTGIVTHIGPSGSSFLHVRTAVLHVERIGLIDRDLGRNAGFVINARNFTGGRYRCNERTVFRGALYIELHRRSSFAARGERRGAIRSNSTIQTFHGERPVAGRDDLHFRSIASVQFYCNRRRVGAIDRNRRNATRTSVVRIIVRTPRKGRCGQYREEQCFPKIYSFHKSECWLKNKNL